MLGLGFPGGPALEKLARDGDPAAFRFPVAMSRDQGLGFSFSGLKTALVYLCRDLGEAGTAANAADLAAGFQAAVVDQLLSRITRALDREPWPAVALGGGVAANGPLRNGVAALCADRGIPFKTVSRELCTDNAAMIGSAARFTPAIEFPGYLDFDAFATGPRSHR